MAMEGAHQRGCWFAGSRGAGAICPNMLALGKFFLLGGVFLDLDDLSER